MKNKLYNETSIVNLKQYAEFLVFERGKKYFRDQRVKITSTTFDTVTAIVRGVSPYHVTLWIKEDELDADCSCPHAYQGYFCKHMVATGMAVHAYIGETPTISWKNQLDNLLDTTQKLAQIKNRRPYFLFFSLQERSNWAIHPYTFSSDGISEEIQNNLLNPQFMEDAAHRIHSLQEPQIDLNPAACINHNKAAVSFAQLLIRAKRLITNDTYYYSYQYVTNRYPLGDLLQLMLQKKLPLYIGNSHKPLKNLANLHLASGVPQLEITETEAGIHVEHHYLVDSQKISNRLTQLNKDHIHPWLLAEKDIFSIRGNLKKHSLELTPFKLDILHEDIDNFIEDYVPEFAKHIELTGKAFTWETHKQDEPPTPRLHLREVEGELQADLYFGYGNYEVKFDVTHPKESVTRKPESNWTLVKIQRQPEMEEQIYRATSSAANGLKFGNIRDQKHIFMLRARVDVIDFLMFKIPNLLAKGFEVYGEEKLKATRVNRHQPTLSLNLTSGIDWFDIEAVIEFGDVRASLKDVRKALRKKQQFIKLADGSIGQIPDEWLKKYKHLFGLVQGDDDTLRLEKHHITMIDQLLMQSDQSQSDEAFKQNLHKIRNFEGIESKPIPASFTGELWPYQKAGYDWLHFLHDYNFGGCLADDMGLGKTIQMLAFLQAQYDEKPESPPSLVVVPRSLLVNWQREAARFTPDLKILEYFGKERHEVIKDFPEKHIIITTYGIMMRDITELRNYQFHYVILDESQAIKNPVAKTSKAARLLNSHYRLALTGTPVQNNIFELWSQFAFLNPGLLGNLEYYKSEFGNPISNGDQASTELLRQMLFPFILRRTKAQVLPDLPPKTERIMYVDMEPAQRKFYEKTREKYRAQLLGLIEDEGMNNARMKILEGLLRLRQISNHPQLVNSDFRGSSAKLEFLLETLETLKEEGHKVLIFSQFVQMLTLVRKELDQRKIPYTYLDGRTRKRQECVDDFQTNPDIPFFLISLKAGGTGLNLTAADYVIHIDPWWNPAVEMQATDRSHRIGQDKPVFVYKLIAKDSVEEKILELQERKKELVEKIISTEGSFFKSLTKDDVAVLFG